MKYTGFALPDEDKDSLFEDAARLVIQHKNASASFLQRKLSLGYARCARILDELQIAGIVGHADGAKPRDIFFKSYEEFQKNVSSPSGIHSLQDEIPKAYKIPDFHLSASNSVPWGINLAPLDYNYPEIPLGMNEQSNLIKIRLDEFDHLLIVGNPQSNKTQFMDALLLSQLLKTTPSQVKLLIIDQSGHFNLYKILPHLLSPTINDYSMTSSALKWTLAEISRRQKLLTEAKVRSITSYNQIPGIDSFAEIILVIRLFDHDKLIDSALTQISSYGQQAGVHLILIVDQASGSYISTQVKANIPNRLVFRTTSASDSTTAGVKGAEKLGTGQAILKVGNCEEVKITTIYASDNNVTEVISDIQKVNI